MRVSRSSGKVAGFVERQTDIARMDAYPHQIMDVAIEPRHTKRIQRGPCGSSVKPSIRSASSPSGSC